MQEIAIGLKAAQGSASLAEIRRAIVNREKLVTPDDMKKLGFIGKFKTLKEANKITGRIELNTEIQGGMEKAQQVLAKVKKEFESRKLIKEGVEELKNGAQRIFCEFEDGSLVQIRTAGKSGHPKVEIKDTVRNIDEKITFI